MTGDDTDDDTDPVCSHELALALRGDDVLFDAIDRADPNTYAFGCSVCGTYNVGKFDELDPEHACCSACGSTHGVLASPALGEGPKPRDMRH